MSPAYGAYPVADALAAGEEISSTYEGRHLTLLESDLIHPAHGDAFVDKGDPVCVATGEQVIVGVAFTSAAAATDRIAIDTEGIWNLDVVATDDDGGSAVAGGDVIYINTSDGILSKISAPATQVVFGYALGIITSGNTETIAVKVHWDPLVETQLQVRGTPGDGVVFASVGNTTNPLVYAAAGDKASEIWATFSLATAGGFYGLESDVLYSPATSGFGTPVGVVGRVTLAASKTFTGGQAGMEGIRGHIQFNDGATLNQASSIFTAIRGVITSSGTPVFTAADTVACLYCDNLCTIDLRGVGVANGSAFASFQNHGNGIDHLIHVHGSGGSPITNIFSIQGVPGFMSGGAAAGSAAKMQMLWGGTTYYINIYQA